MQTRRTGLVPDLVTVVVPAHDEATLLPSCLASVEIAATQVHVDVEVVVVLDACSDDSRDLVPSWCRVVEVAQANVGAARCAGFAAARPTPRGWYATTDADTVVPPTWLAVQLECALRHDVFVGTVHVDDWAPRATGLRTLYDALYQPVAGHPHVHGANLGLSAEAYAAVGGFHALDSGEDEDLVRRLESSGRVVERTAAAPVTTSARLSTRVSRGFSDFLGGLEAGMAT